MSDAHDDGETPRLPVSTSRFASDQTHVRCKRPPTFWELTLGIVKTPVVKRSDGTYLFAPVPGGRAISWPKLRGAGVNKLRLPEAELAPEATGYERGTITPIGSTHDWPVFADETIVGQCVAMGAGRTASACLSRPMT